MPVLKWVIASTCGRETEQDAGSPDMDRWNIALWIGAGYVAVVALMRLMAHKRQQVMTEFRGEVEREKGRRKAAAKQLQSKPPRKAA
jgi:hypothetical protein